MMENIMEEIFNPFQKAYEDILKKHSIAHKAAIENTKDKLMAITAEQMRQTTEQYKIPITTIITEIELWIQCKAQAGENSFYFQNKKLTYEEREHIRKDFQDRVNRWKMYLQDFAKTHFLNPEVLNKF